jgi:endogenous inhibitor of DNA gyrase (YacG/DUF329 family)
MMGICFSRFDVKIKKLEGRYMRRISQRCISVMVGMWSDEITKIVNSGEKLEVSQEEKELISKFYPHIELFDLLI